MGCDKMDLRKLGVYSFTHMLVDFSCAFLIFFTLKSAEYFAIICRCGIAVLCGNESTVFMERRLVLGLDIDFSRNCEIMY